MQRDTRGKERKGLSIFNNTRMVSRTPQSVFCKFALNSFASERVINHICNHFPCENNGCFKHVEKVKD